MKLANVARCCDPATTHAVDGTARAEHIQDCFTCSGARARFKDHSRYRALQLGGMRLSAASHCSPSHTHAVDAAERLAHVGLCWESSGARGRYRGRAIGALYHTVTDVIEEKQRMWGVVNQTVAAWNQCSAGLTSAAAAQLGTDFAAWWTNWSNFANAGQESLAIVAGVEPADTEWDQMQAIEQQLVTLTGRINAMCRSGLPGPTPSGVGAIPPLAYLAVAGVAAILLTVVVVEVGSVATAVEKRP